MEINFSRAPIHIRKRLFIWIMRLFVLLCCTFTFGLNPVTGFSQNIKINIDHDQELSVIDVFELIKKETDYRFVYRTESFKNAPSVKLNKGIITAHDLLSRCLSSSNYLYELTADKTIILKQKPPANQNRTISGKVTDENGVPLPGVTILVHRNENNNFRGTTTDFDGGYEIAVQKGDIVKFSYVGFLMQRIVIEDQTIINITMKEDASKLDEVVVVAYGSESREKLTGAVDKVDIGVLQTTQNVSFADALIGVVPGLLVQESFNNPDTPPSILLRGVGSINADTEPLIVIDGVQMPAGLASSALNVNDIEGISILKDAAATSIYGSRGSNGVILVTTKRGTKNSKLQVAVNTRLGFNNPNTSFTDDLMNASQKLDYEESLGFYDSDAALLDERRNSGNDINWTDLLVSNEVSQNHDIAISGGGNNSSYYTSISYSNVDNIFGSEYERYTATMRADFEFSKKIKLALSGNFGNVNNQDRRDVGNPFSNAFLLNPWEQAFDDSGNPTRLISFLTSGGGEPLNPLFVRDNTSTRSVRKNIGGSVNLIYKPLEWLTLNGILGANYNTSKNTTYENEIVEGGELNLSNGNNNNYTATLMATVDKTFNQHNFNLLLGNEFNENEISSFTGIGRGFESDAVQTLSAAANPPTIFDTETHAGSISYFSRLNYSFNNTYNLSLSYRRDGSSRFGDNNKYANFWAIGTSWNLHNTLFKESETVNNLKLRFTTGTSGNDFIGNFSSQSLYQYRFNYDDAGVPTLSRGANPDLTWEKNENTNFGLDFGLFNNRINGSIDYYIRTTKDLLAQIPTPLTSGFDFLDANIGNFENKGFEIALNTINVQNDNFRWTTNITFATNEGTVVSLIEDRDLILRGNIAYKPDSPINALYLVDWAGVNPDTGFNQYRDTEGNLIDYDTNLRGGNRNEITELREASDKTAIPTYHGGVTNAFTFRNFDASFLVSFSGGNHILNTGLHSLYNNVNLNQHIDVLNAWQNPGDQTNIAVRTVDSRRPTTRILTSDFLQSTQFVQDASYIKLKNIVIGYTLNKTVSKKIGIERLRIFAQAQNILTITDVDYIDPEFASGLGGIGLSAPINTGFSFGINANF
ncbi:SusC/RagA family TonB-linked outer membrane protein [Hyunsoonleella pacifica]|uniref:SusC/RagA family TonB-linked outer membrane protein n=1 Tax=Hyunsoonleella pacifica TaxID=1080224 RepID=A0A4Q9FRJ0_9FLAO|nr:SusC/RagA family TonB-linked outer membrane protein [Hyunsoonleella pacifica]TBN16284.1 SusC/RagA family TonB-linked outer membrane protein [Hyunsoonleella pacifica]